MEDMGLLKKIEFFRELSPRELKRINMIIERAVFNAGNDIVREGTVCDAFYLVKNGSVDVLKAGNLLVTVGKEEPLGEISFIDKGPRSATLRAKTDTILIKIPSAAFDKLLGQETEIAAKIYKAIAMTLCRRLRETDEILKLIG